MSNGILSLFEIIEKNIDRDIEHNIDPGFSTEPRSSTYVDIDPGFHINPTAKSRPDYVERLNNLENILIDGMILDKNLFVQDSNFENWSTKWNDPAFRDKYIDIKDKVNSTGVSDISVGYESKNYIGYLEDSEEMYNDVFAASDETGVDVNFLYNVGMFEGIVQNRPSPNRGNTNIFGRDIEPFQYGSDFWTNTYWDVGLDAMFDEQDSMINKGYLKSPIKSVGEHDQFYRDHIPAILADVPHAAKEQFNSLYWKETNEAGAEFTQGDIYAKDAWRGVGGLLRLNEDYVKSTFDKKGYDWEGLDKKTKQFFIYAAYNGGSGNVAKLIETYGPNPLSSKEFSEALNFGERNIFDDNPFHSWMSNIMGVINGTEIVTESDPWNVSK